jgi:hypothetical protein
MVAQYEMLSWTLPDGTEKTHKKNSQHIRCLRRDLNRLSFEYSGKR